MKPLNSYPVFMFSGVKILTPWLQMCRLMVEWKKLIVSVAALCLSLLCQMAQDLCWSSEGYIPRDIPEVLKPPTVLQKVSLLWYEGRAVTLINIMK
jgi:hypothetical protein